jgi:tetratricopeptide (TPR) repeat protein
MIEFDRLIDRLPSARSLVVAVAALVVVVLLGGGGWYWYAASQRQAAAVYSAALAQAHASPSAPPDAGAKTSAMRALEGALESHPSAPMAAEAAYELGNLRYDAGLYAPARSAYEVALGRATSPTLKVLARLAVGYTWEAERDLAKATEAFEAVVAGLTPGAAFYEQALLDLARVHELNGRKDDAVQTYRRVLEDSAGSARANEIRLRLASLGATP